MNRYIGVVISWPLAVWRRPRRNVDIQQIFVLLEARDWRIRDRDFGNFHKPAVDSRFNRAAVHQTRRCSRLRALPVQSSRWRQNSDRQWVLRFDIDMSQFFDALWTFFRYRSNLHRVCRGLRCHAFEPVDLNLGSEGNRTREWLALIGALFSAADQ